MVECADFHLINVIYGYARGFEIFVCILMQNLVEATLKGKEALLCCQVIEGSATMTLCSV